jgi:hypothetical protein
MLDIMANINPASGRHFKIRFEAATLIPLLRGANGPHAFTAFDQRPSNEAVASAILAAASF